MRLSYTVLILVASTVAIFCLLPSPGMTEEKKAVQYMDLNCASSLHLRLEEKCRWRGCQIRYDGPLAFYVPRKLRPIRESREHYERWSFIALDDELNNGQILFHLHFGLEPSKFDLGKLTVEGKAVYCRVARMAHDDTDESVYKGRTQTFKQLKFTPLEGKTLEEIVKLLIAE